MDMPTLTSFLGWFTLYNLIFLAACALLLIPFKGPFSRFHGWLFDVDPVEVRKLYFTWIAVYEILWFLFALMPWLVLTTAM